MPKKIKIDGVWYRIRESSVHVRQPMAKESEKELSENLHTTSRDKKKKKKVHGTRHKVWVEKIQEPQYTTG